MNSSVIQSIGIQGLANTAKSEAKIAQMLQLAAQQSKIQADSVKVSVSPEAMKLLLADRG